MPTAAASDVIEPQSIKRLCLKSLKRTFELFLAAHDQRAPQDPSSREVRLKSKIYDEYRLVKEMAPPAAVGRDAQGGAAVPAGQEGAGSAQATDAGTVTGGAPGKAGAKSATTNGGGGGDNGLQLALKAPEQTPGVEPKPAAGAVVEATPMGLTPGHMTSAQIMKRLPSKWPKPVWHPPWKNYRVISGHLGWVRSVAFDPSNEWFVTGSADRTIKFWDTASGKLKLTLTGHIEQVRGLAVSPRHPYLFSAGDDKLVKCWDLEMNKVIRSYHGHLSGVYCLALHPTLDILMTGGRDSVCRVWDMRTKAQIFALSGHQNTVCSVITQPTDPQIITGSHDTTVKMWDLAAGKALSTLTYHKKSVRALAMHPFEHTFASASADNIKKFRLPRGDFLHNMLSAQRTIVNCMAVNEDNVMVSGGDNGSLWAWDWKSGHNYQKTQTVVQPGSLDSEAGIYALSFDSTGTRLVTCEADKTIKMWREDETATPETHPIHFRPPKDMRRF